LTSSIWALSVPPAAACLAVLLLTPRTTWAALRERMPAVSAGLSAALLLGALGFAVNDSGIAIPSMILAFFVPYVLIARLYAMDGPGR
jgi:fructose-specific phosphotransferase system IIC component